MLANCAFPGESQSRLYREELREAFINALGNPDVRTEVWRSNPRDIVKAATAASQIEVLIAKNKLPAGSGNEGSQGRTASRQVSGNDRSVRAVGQNNTCSNNEPWRAEIGTLQKVLEEVRKNVTSLISRESQRKVTPQPQPRQFMRQARASASNRPAGCHQCGDLQHWKKDCPQLSAAVSSAPGAQE